MQQPTPATSFLHVTYLNRSNHVRPFQPQPQNATDWEHDEHWFNNTWVCNEQIDVTGTQHHQGQYILQNNNTKQTWSMTSLDVFIRVICKVHGLVAVCCCYTEGDG